MNRKSSVLWCGFLCGLTAMGLMSAPALAQDEPGGESLTIESAWKEISKQHKAGGTTNYFIEFLSVVSMAIVVERLVRLRRSSVAPAGMADEARRLWKAGKHGEVKSLCEKNPGSTLSKVILFIVDNKDMPLADIRQSTSDIASRDIEMHQLFLYPLAAIATLAPLLGLFGTVVGMIEAFDLVALAGNMGDPSILSKSIAKALVTTEFGLIVAMISLFFFGFFRMRTSMLSHLLEEESSVLTNEWLMRK